MCVIMLVNDQRPTETMLEKAWTKSGDGGGGAWREPGEKGETFVVWEKGLKLDRMIELAETLPLPFVLHFRKATCGGVRLSLTHPFVISKTADSALTGKTKGYVLFHNGEWKEWAQEVRYAAYVKNIPIPTGKMSDSRAIAWLSSFAGIGFMETLPTQRGLAFGPKDFEIYSGPGWTQIQGVWCSKDEFMTTHVPMYYNSGRVCEFDKCARRDTDRNGRCPLHPMIGEAREVPGVHDSHPFRVGLTSGAIVPLPVAERLQNEGKISKNFLKALRKAHGRMEAGGKDGEKARKALVAASRLQIFDGLRVSIIPRSGENGPAENAAV